jgi:hypothetical protein
MSIGQRGGAMIVVQFCTTYSMLFVPSNEVEGIAADLDRSECSGGRNTKQANADGDAKPTVDAIARSRKPVT